MRCRDWFSEEHASFSHSKLIHTTHLSHWKKKVVITYKDQLKILTSGFPGVSVAKNPPASAGDTGSVPGLGRSHVQRSNEAREPQLLKPGHPEPLFHKKRSHCSEKLVRAPREEPHSSKDLAQSKISVLGGVKMARNRTGDHFLFYKFIERTTER